MTSRRDDQVMTRLSESLEAYPLERAEQEGMGPALPSQGAQAEARSVDLAGRGEAVLDSRSAALNLFGTSDPVAVIEHAARVATALKAVIVKQKLYATIGSGDKAKNHVTVEGWTLLGAMLGVFTHTEWTRRVRGSETADYQRDGWEARVVAVSVNSGAVLGSAEQMCTREEPRWKGAEDYAVRGMSQTRAQARALKGPLGFIMKLAGFSSTPAEEMRS